MSMAQFIRHGVLAILVIATGLSSQVVEAQTVTNCRIPIAVINLGDIPQPVAASRFAVISAGTVDLKNSVAQKLQISGCDADAQYNFYYNNPLTVSRDGVTFELWPVVVAVNGVSQTPKIIASSTNTIALSGNPELDIVFAIRSIRFPSSFPLGVWSGSGFVTFTDR